MGNHQQTVPIFGTRRQVKINWVFALEAEKQGYQNVKCYGTGLSVEATWPAMLVNMYK